MKTGRGIIYSGEKLARLMAAMTILLDGGCATLHEPWTYLNPPPIDSYFNKADKIIWCKTRTSAQAMAITGFFAVGCQYTTLKADTFRVTELSRGTFGTTSVTFVRCEGPGGEIWIPLPSHAWA